MTSIAGIITFGKRKGACTEALEWLRAQKTPEQAWQTCERPDWMIWFARQRNVEHKTLVRIACDCARTALRFVPEDEDRPRLAIETTERWLIDEATIEEVRTARNAAYAAAYAADAAYAAAYAVAAAVAADAHRQANIQMCEIVRRHISYAQVAL